MQDSTRFSSAPYIEHYDIPGGLEQALYMYYLNRPLLSKNLKWCNDYFSYKAGFQQNTKQKNTLTAEISNHCRFSIA